MDGKEPSRRWGAGSEPKCLGDSTSREEEEAIDYPVFQPAMEISSITMKGQHSGTGGGCGDTMPYIHGLYATTPSPCSHSEVSWSERQGIDHPSNDKQFCRKNDLDSASQSSRSTGIQAAATLETERSLVQHSCAALVCADKSPEEKSESVFPFLFEKESGASPGKMERMNVSVCISLSLLRPSCVHAADAALVL
ncbi:hypothetical protein E5288_WYG001172 [Bos mutus]|uniref:Uncharacterized protein n=1 Tax=Bos mutus TaxID=72004 RepID=A0A6B0RW73_9CETA|nr:hypothetical protein [Bos mutus]